MSGLAAKLPVMTKALVDYSTPRLARFWYYAKVELTPPSPADIPKITQGVQKLMNSTVSGKWKTVTVKVGITPSKYLIYHFIGSTFP